ncbi:MAG: HesA/MoeB/ThiF family protein [Leptospirales bacterium]|nr:HesA/MoeB/ThiF family protein [Leptospirales bacterium]
MFTENELVRYKRQMEISFWDITCQEKLKSSSVFVAGAGGLGSPVLYYLSSAGIGTIKVCDIDVVDLSNLNRQILYSAEDIGNLKSETAAKKISMLNNNINIKHINAKAGWDTLDEIKTCNIIVDCLDNFESRHILNEISVQNKIPMVHGGVTEYYGQMTFLHPDETPCLACFIPQNIKKEVKGIVGAMAGIVGSMQAMEVIKYLTGTGDLLKNRLMYIDARSMDITTINIHKNPKCKICSTPP